MTNAQTWTVIISVVIFAPLLLALLIVTWGDRGKAYAQAVTAFAPAELLDEADEDIDDVIDPISAADAKWIKEAVNARPGWTPEFARHLVDEIDRVSTPEQAPPS